MATWREWVLGAIIAVLLILAVHGMTEGQRVLCQNLNVPTRLVHDDPDIVNQMLEICGIRNVNIESPEDFNRRMEAYLNITKPTNLSAGTHR